MQHMVKYKKPFVKADYYGVDPNVNDRVTQYTLDKTGFNREQFLRGNGFDTVQPTDTKKLVTVYKNILSKHELNPFGGYAIRSKRLGSSLEGLGTDGEESDPCKLDQTNKNNILTCELWSMLQKRLKAHDYGYKYIDVGDSYCNCDTLMHPCKAYEQLLRTKKDFEKQFYNKSDPRDPDAEPTNAELAEYTDHVKNSNKKMYGYENYFSDTDFHPDKKHVFLSSDFEEFNHKSEEVRASDGYRWQKLWNSFMEVRNHTVSSTFNQAMNSLQLKVQQAASMKAQNKFLQKLSAKFNQKLMNKFSLQLLSKLSSAEKVEFKQFLTMNKQRFNENKTNVYKFLNTIKNPLNYMASLYEVKKAEFKLECCCSMYSYTQLGKGSVNNYNHYYRNGLGAGNLVKGLTTYATRLVLSRNMVLANPMCSKYPTTAIANCIPQEKFQVVIRQMFNKTFDKLMGQDADADSDTGGKGANANKFGEPVADSSATKLNSFRALNFEKYDSDMVYAGLEQPVLVLNYVRNNNELMDAYKYLWKIGEADMDKVLEYESKAFPLIVKDEGGIRIVWKFPMDKFDKYVKKYGSKWTDLKHHKKGQYDLFLNESVFGEQDSSDNQSLQKKVKNTLKNTNETKKKDSEEKPQDINQ